MLEALERDLVSPEIRNDRARMTELLADDFEEYGSSGRVFYKSDVLSAPDFGAAYDLSDFTFTDLAEGVVLVKYKAVVSNQESLRSSIWVKASSSWQLLHHQATVVPSAT
ncbi:DUF4440 domain-containing protein [Pseudohalioglobus lutimaris]|nr:DUF4440 domain-containing protein [Pseudohalioglobus lutimaris]